MLHQRNIYIYLFLFRCIFKTQAALFPRINEISDKGTSNVCNGEDWIELYLDVNTTNNSNNGNTESFSIDLSGYILHDDNGAYDSDAFTIKNGTRINPGQYLLFCLGGDDASISP